MDNADYIYKVLRENGYSFCGTCGILGNLYAESNLKPNNLQDTYNTTFGMTDAKYTEETDNGKYKSFERDAAGYGLAQWTYGTRKAKLYEFIKKRGDSIGSLEGQTAFLIYELEHDYKSLSDMLKMITDTDTACKTFMEIYERPQDTTTTAIRKRQGFARDFEKRFTDKNVSHETYVFKIPGYEITIKAVE